MSRHHKLHDGKSIHLGGWKRDLPDHRDAHYARSTVSLDEAARLPATFVDMKVALVKALGVYDQGQIGSCTANASLAAFRWLYWKSQQAKKTPSGPIPDYSRLYQYAKTRMDEGTPLSDDSGCSIRDAIGTLHQHGACPESLWPYDDGATFDIKPPSGCDVEAKKHETLSYHSVPDLTALKREIAGTGPGSGWYPVVGGFTVYESMMSAAVAKTGIVPNPGPGEDVAGGHAILFVGYCDVRRAVCFLNSWGPSWGDGGCGWLPYWYFQHGLVDDLWTIHTAEGITF